MGSKQSHHNHHHHRQGNDSNCFLFVFILLLFFVKNVESSASPWTNNNNNNDDGRLRSIRSTVTAIDAWRPGNLDTTTAMATGGSFIGPGDETAADEDDDDGGGDDVIYGDEVGDYDGEVGYEGGEMRNPSDDSKHAATDSDNNNDNGRNNDNTPSQSEVILKKDLSPGLDEQISRMFEMKMMPLRVQHDDVNNNNNNNNNGSRTSNNNWQNKSNNINHNSNNKRNGKNGAHFQADEEDGDDPILEKIVSIKWMTNNNNKESTISTRTTTTTTAATYDSHYDNNFLTMGVHGNAPDNETGTTRQQHQQQHRQQQQQHDPTSKYDQLQQQLFELKIDRAEPQNNHHQQQQQQQDHHQQQHHHSPAPINPGLSEGVWKSRPNKADRGRQYHTGDRKRQTPESSKLKRRLPQAIIVGVKKAGTRALLEFLRRHPMVKGAGPEVHYFDKNYYRGLQWYRGKMPPSSEEHLTIEKTPAYFINKMAPIRIRSMNNKTRLLLVVRNPVDRLISHYAQRHSRKPNMSKFEVTVVRNFPNKKNMVVDGSRESVQQGLYAKYLQRWLRYFPLEQIAIIDGENLVANPYEEVSKLESFLGLQPFFTPGHFVPNASRGFPCFRSVKRRLSDDSDCFKKLSPGGSRCDDLSADGDEDDDDDEGDDGNDYDFVENETGTDELESPIATAATTINSGPPFTHDGDDHDHDHDHHNYHQESTLNPDGKPVSYGNAFHILSLPNVSMYFPNQMVAPLPQPPQASSVAHEDNSSSLPSSTYGRKKRDKGHHHHLHRHHHRRHRQAGDPERSRGNRKGRKQNQESLPASNDGEEEKEEEPMTEQDHHQQQQYLHHNRTQRPNKPQPRNQQKQQQQQKKSKSSTNTATPSSLVGATKVKGRLHCLNEGKGRVHPKVDGDVIRLLGNFYRPHNERFFRLVGRRFHWS